MRDPFKQRRVIISIVFDDHNGCLTKYFDDNDLYDLKGVYHMRPDGVFEVKRSFVDGYMHTIMLIIELTEKRRIYTSNLELLL